VDNLYHIDHSRRDTATQQYSVFLIGAGIVHIKEMVKAKNFAPGNAGMPLYMDFLKPVVIWVLLTIYLV
jgi:hypothetical protein